MVQFNGGEHMSVTQYRSLCHQNRGRAVRIRTRDGIIHRGVIDHVDHHSVFIRPNPRNQRLGGFASGFFRWLWRIWWIWAWSWALSDRIRNYYCYCSYSPCILVKKWNRRRCFRLFFLCRS